MKVKPIRGVFKVIYSFSIKRREEYYLIGELSKGEIQPGWYFNITINSSVDFSFQIKAIEDVDFSNNDGQYKLIIIDSDPDSTEFMELMAIGGENVFISEEGPDY